MLLQGRSVPALTGGSSSSGTTTATIPASTADGVYFLIAKADGTGARGGIQRDEQHAHHAPPHRSRPRGHGGNGPGQGGRGASIDVTETTQKADRQAGASLTGFYLSANALLDSSDVRLGSRTRPRWLRARPECADDSGRRCRRVSAGTWNLLVNADDDRAIAETLETNNTRAVSLLVGPGSHMLMLRAAVHRGGGLDGYGRRLGQEHWRGRCGRR